MPSYKNEKCPVCNQEFKDGDDIVPALSAEHRTTESATKKSVTALMKISTPRATNLRKQMKQKLKKRLIMLIRARL